MSYPHRKTGLHGRFRFSFLVERHPTHRLHLRSPDAHLPVTDIEHHTELHVVQAPESTRPIGYRPAHESIDRKGVRFSRMEHRARTGHLHLQKIGDGAEQLLLSRPRTFDDIAVGSSVGSIHESLRREHELREHRQRHEQRSHSRQQFHPFFHTLPIVFIRRTSPSLPSADRYGTTGVRPVI